MKTQLNKFLLVSGLMLMAGVYTACAPVTLAVDTPASAPSATAAVEVTPTRGVIRVMTATARAPIVKGTQQEAPGMNETPVSSPLNAAQEKSVGLARADLMKKLNVSAEVVELVSISEVSWPDGSLGCPQPGMMYTQMVMDGLRIQLRVKGEIYDYHSSKLGTPFLCKK